jgi:Lon protease-like protein
LHGIAEWRDKTFDFPGNDRRPLGGKPSDETQALPMLLKEICILPFPFFEVLLQGETKQLRLYEERFLQLFEYCMEHHHGVVAMGLLASGDNDNTGIIQTVPLCEIEAYHRMDGFGIFVTIRVVGRAQLHEIMQQQSPYIKAVCRELHDQIPPNLELPNLLAGTIENYLMLLSNMEAQLVQAAPPPPKANVTNETDTTDDDEDEDDDDSAMTREMKRRIEVAKLVRRYIQK